MLDSNVCWMLERELLETFNEDEVNKIRHQPAFINVLKLDLCWNLITLERCSNRMLLKSSQLEFHLCENAYARACNLIWFRSFKVFLRNSLFLLINKVKSIMHVGVTERKISVIANSCWYLSNWIHFRGLNLNRFITNFLLSWFLFF